MFRFLCQAHWTMTLMVVILPTSSLASTSDDVKNGCNKLLENYNKNIRPRYNQEETVDINVSLHVGYVHGLEEKYQRLTFSGWLDLVWQDEFLQWNESDYGGLSNVLLPVTDLWIPDIELFNSYEWMTLTQDVMARVESTGRVTWSPGHTFRTLCLVDITYYPFDTQTCAVAISTWLSKARHVNLHFSYIGGVLSFFPNNEWEVELGQGKRYLDSFFSGRPAYDARVILQFNLRLKRRRMFSLLFIILPVLLFSILGVIVFLLPPATGEKMALSATVFLTFAVYKSSIHDSLPQTSLHVSILSVYMVILMILLTLAVILTSLVLIMHHKTTPTEGRTDSQKSRENARDDSHGNGIITDDNAEKALQPNDKDSRKKNSTARLASLLDRIFFFLFLGLTITACATTIIYYLKQ